jgi:nitrite reductase/ring-hydroxylating ferredoxin subunit
MSDALNYLLKVRPEAMGHYFAFLKDAGKHLEPKTRALISVITKVHAQTDRGLRQYLVRALRAGCTPAEVLDALLMAFPALGLAKIVWAVDVILAMDLPEFRAEALPGERGEWHDLMAEAELRPGQVRRVDCDGRGVFVYAEGEDIRVFDSLCPHQGTEIPHLALQGHTLTCPKHRWAFDARSGECTQQGNPPLRRWPAHRQDGRVLARW